MKDHNQFDVTLRVDGQTISLNHFVETVFAGVIQGLIDSLDKIPPDPEKIELLIERR